MLDAAVAGVFLLCGTFLLCGLPALGKTLGRAFRDIDPVAAGLLVLAAAGHGLFLKPLIPHNIWHENFGVSALLAFERPPALDSWWSLHGPAFDGIMTLAHWALGGTVSIFSVNYAVSIGSAGLLFLLLHLLTGRGTGALSGALTLMFLPAHLRLSTTESRFILVEFFALLSLFLLAVFGRSKKPLSLLLAAASALILMHLRAEMMALVPAVAAVYGFFLRNALRPEPGSRGAVRAGLAAAGLLAVPRAAQIWVQASPRVWDAPGPTGVLSGGLKGLTPFFDPEVTPVVFPLLALAGAAFLFRKNRRLFWAANLHWFLTALFYTRHANGFSAELRMGAASLYVLAAAAAFGLDSLTGSLKGSAGRAAGLAACMLLPLAPALRWGFLTGLYTQQQEYLFLRKIAGRPPDGAVVVHLSDADDPGVLQYRDFQRELFLREAQKEGKNLVVIGIGDFAELRGALGNRAVYFYAGADCLRVPLIGGGPSPVRADPDFVHPLCGKMMTGFRLTPVLTARIGNRSLRAGSIQSDRRSIGLYKVAGAGGEPATSGREPRRGDAAFWTGVAEAARSLHTAAGAAGLEGEPARAAALRALNRARLSGPNDREAMRMALAYQDWGAYREGLSLLDEAGPGAEADASFLTIRGTLRALAGRTQEAISDLEAALERDAPPIATHLTLGGLYASAGKRAEALKVYDAALKKCRFQPLCPASDRAVAALIRNERRKIGGF